MWTLREGWRALATLTLILALCPSIGPAQQTLPSPRAVPGEKSETSAFWLSFGTTTVPLIVAIASASDGDGMDSAAGLTAAAGLYLGPATGYWYGGASGRGWKGVALRTGVGLGATLMIVAICSGGCPLWGDDSGATGAAGAVGLAAAAVILISDAVDIANVTKHVRRRNEELRDRFTRQTRVRLAPAVSPANGGSFGLIGRLSF